MQRSRFGVVINELVFALIGIGKGRISGILYGRKVYLRVVCCVCLHQYDAELPLSRLILTSGGAGVGGVGGI